jgi:hypothetical protein
MRSRNIALGCALAGTLGLAVLPPAPARAVSTAGAISRARAMSTGSATGAAGVRKAAPALSVAASAVTYAYASRVRLTVSLSRTYANRRVLIYAAPVGLRHWLWHSGTVNAAGQLRAYFRLTRTTTFTAVFGGDARDAPARASRTLYAAAHVAEALSGYSAKTRARGITYYVFRARRMLVLHVTVSPNKRGECLQPETEQWDTGLGWDDRTTYGCDSLDGASHDSAPFNLVQAVGDRYRIRADYVRGAQDRANLSADGPWLYLMVVK